MSLCLYVLLACISKVSIHEKNWSRTVIAVAAYSVLRIEKTTSHSLCLVSLAPVLALLQLTANPWFYSVPQWLKQKKQPPGFYFDHLGA